MHPYHVTNSQLQLGTISSHKHTLQSLSNMNQETIQRNCGSITTISRDSPKP